MRLRMAKLGATIAALLLVPTSDLVAQPAPAAAVPPSMPASFSEFALPYAPYLFDFAVYAGRNLARITYRSRRYDPVTKALVVTGLSVERDGFSAAVGQIRVAADGVAYEDVAVDTRGLPLDPAVREALQRLDSETVTGDLIMTAASDVAAADYDVNLVLRAEKIGTFDVTADLAGFHILAPLEDLAEGGSEMPTVIGQLRSGRIGFTDAGLAAVLYDMAGERQGLTGEQARGAVAMMAGIGVASVVAGLSDGAGPELQRRGQEWSATAQAFLAKPDRLDVTFAPVEPFDLSRLTDGEIGEAEILALNPSAVAGIAARVPLRDPATLVGEDAPPDAVLDAAEALLEGRGVPQDVARAVALALPLAVNDNRRAMGILARGLAADPGVAIPQDELAGAYLALLIARADGLTVDDAGLVALRGRLSPEETVAAEDEAVQRWRAMPVGQEQKRVEVAAFAERDWATVRRFAYAYYEGVTMPRNLLRAYGWASIAAAGGDPLAGRLRDDLSRAVGSGLVALPLDRAREATDDLWRLLVTEANGGAAAPAGPLEGKADTAVPASPAPPAASVPDAPARLPTE
ncbi:sel1 repeat family protein [Aurantimonas endophytica]|uniref:TPR repeat protein n=1 Tax=Aurantimonas endophytica TaxID=1522175 RepID=A0A7W6HHH3_9HYPH|nr:sel1 repeat family protein [Aurantimonas endophytica]MBB4005273.1 TPR repeat protein [Aurantimonas endophytica]MCO6406065.1 hypothetical protein [Aurantimonas endophytica]